MRVLIGGAARLDGPQKDPGQATQPYGAGQAYPALARCAFEAKSSVCQCNSMRPGARGTRMHAIITIRPKTGAENEVLGIGAHEPLGLKLRKGARGHMHWGAMHMTTCYFGTGEAVSHSNNSTPWRFFVRS